MAQMTSPSGLIFTTLTLSQMGNALAIRSPMLSPMLSIDALRAYPIFRGWVALLNSPPRALNCSAPDHGDAARAAALENPRHGPRNHASIPRDL